MLFITETTTGGSHKEHTIIICLLVVLDLISYLNACSTQRTFDFYPELFVIQLSQSSGAVAKSGYKSVGFSKIAFSFESRNLGLAISLG